MDLEPQDDWILDDELGIRLPPKPPRPGENECCGTGCNPCVMQLYQMRLRTWKKQVKQLKADAGVG